jgi:hypothetical protein
MQIKSTTIRNARIPNIIKASSIDKKAQVIMKTCKHKNKNTPMGLESSKHHDTTSSGSTMLKTIKNNIIMNPHSSKCHDIIPSGPTMLETQKKPPY